MLVALFRRFISTSKTALLCFFIVASLQASAQPQSLEEAFKQVQQAFIQQNSLITLELVSAFIKMPEYTHLINQTEGAPDNRTLVHMAVDSGDTEVIEILAKSGADLEISDAKGFTPLKLAYFKNDATAQEILLKAGAKPLSTLNKMKVFAQTPTGKKILTATALIGTFSIGASICLTIEGETEFDEMLQKLPGQLSTTLQAGNADQFKSQLDAFITQHKDEGAQYGVLRLSSNADFKLLNNICKRQAPESEIAKMVQCYFEHFSVSKEDFFDLFLGALEDNKYIIARSLMENSLKVDCFVVANLPYTHLGLSLVTNESLNKRATALVSKYFEPKFESNMSLLQVAGQLRLTGFVDGFLSILLYRSEDKVLLAQQFTGITDKETVDKAIEAIKDYIFSRCSVDEQTMQRQQALINTTTALLLNTPMPPTNCKILDEEINKLARYLDELKGQVEHQKQGPKFQIIKRAERFFNLVPQNRKDLLNARDEGQKEKVIRDLLQSQ